MPDSRRRAITRRLGAARTHTWPGHSVTGWRPRLGAARTLSPDAPCGHPALRSLGGVFACSGTDWVTSTGENRYRRGLYTRWRRSNPYPSMATFDAPNREVCTIRRPQTNTPLQALVLLNDPVYLEAAQALARRMVRDGGSTMADRIIHGFRLCLTRFPTQAENDRLAALHATVVARYAADRKAAATLATTPLGPLPAGADPIDMAAWTMAASALLNLDECVMCP